MFGNDMTFVDVLFVFAVAIFVEVIISTGKPSAPGFIFCLAGSFLGYFLVETLFP